jgi:hypothetical protein
VNLRRRLYARRLWSLKSFPRKLYGGAGGHTPYHIYILIVIQLRRF